MSVYFADTSALAKRYLRESGTNWTLSWILPQVGHVVIVSELTIVEMFSSLARRQREGTLSAQSAQVLQNNLLLHCEQEYLLISLDSAILRQARQLVSSYVLRSLDAIQLASALQAANILGETLIFVSGDKNLLTAATAEGFPADDPNAYP